MLFALLLLVTAIYFEGDGLEIHRLIVGLIGLFEGVFFIRVLNTIDKNATENNWTTSKTIGLKTFSALGLIIIMVTIDRLINYILTSYGKDYKIIWTIIVPGTILATTLFKLLDIWSYENEKRDRA